MARKRIKESQAIFITVFRVQGRAEWEVWTDTAANGFFKHARANKLKCTAGAKVLRVDIVTGAIRVLS